MKTLYISDLDGTLLGSKAQLSDFAIENLNKLIHSGMNFSYATARTPVTTSHILKDVDINIPVCNMNGVCIYDVKEQKYISKKAISPSDALSICNAIGELGIYGFMFKISEDKLSACYRELSSPHMRAFYEERRKLYKHFVKAEHLPDMIDDDVVYFSFTDTYEKLQPLKSFIESMDTIAYNFYQDVYNIGNWYLEISNKDASKYNAVKFIKDYCGFGEVVGFGDNLNDIPLFKACDRRYAVLNAKDELKQMANKVIGGNCEDGVTKWLLENYKR